mgnify:CR=1 FL=1
MQGFELECTTKIYFGTGILEEAIRKSAEKLKGNILIIVTGNSVKKYGYLGIHVLIFFVILFIRFYDHPNSYKSICCRLHI